MKLFEHQETDKTLDRLPELPPDVQVPDDISGIEPPATKQTTGGVRWMRWLAAIVLLGGAGVLTAVLLSNDADETPVDYMETYGTDNPVILSEGAEPGTVDIVAGENYMALYGTDNPAFLPEPSSMELYGTDNPVFVTDEQVDVDSYLKYFK